MRLLTATLSACAFLISFSSVAHASPPDTALLKVTQTLSHEDATADSEIPSLWLVPDEVVRPSQLILSLKDGPRTIEVLDFTHDLAYIFKANGYDFKNYQTAEGEPLDPTARVLPNTTYYFFAIVADAQYETIELPSPEETIESFFIPEGEKITIKPGEPGRAVITTVTTKKRRAANSIVATTTVLKAPTTKTVLIGKNADGKVGLVLPVAGPLTSPYGMRYHPVTHVYKLHDGSDFGASCGTPVKALTGGTVTHAKYLTGYGNQVEIDHGGGMKSSYSHLTSYDVKEGDAIQPGQTLGYVGSTGYSTGCHLHFMVWLNNETIDPYDFLQENNVL